MKKIISCFCCFAIFAIKIFAQDIKADQPPEGFSWKILPFVNGAILKPDDWNFNHIDVPDEKRYMFIIARENYQSGEKVRTVLNIVVIRDIPAKKNMKASEYAKDMINNISLQTRLENRFKKDHGKFLEEGFFRVDKSSIEPGTIREYFTTLSNDDTGTVYIISFVTPIEKWEKDFPIAETMIKNIRLDENF